jgi:RimJ/RimL family protein N-acetyltransferase
MNLAFPSKIVLKGDAVRLEPLSIAHADDLWTAAQGADASWDYLRYGPFGTADALKLHVAELAQRETQPFWAVRESTSGAIQGWLSLCDVYPADAAIEIGSIWYSPALQRTRAGTEAVSLLMKYAFDALGYRRLVWRCSAANLTSCRAALRYGFVPEGTWRSAAIVKGREMDIAWFSMLASEWPERRAAIGEWLSSDNFGGDGEALAPMARGAARQ